MSRKIWIWVTATLVLLISFPPQWYPEPVRLQLAAWLGADAYRPLPSTGLPSAPGFEIACPEDVMGWREAQVIDDVRIRPSPNCVADDPYAVVAFVRGTNNVSESVLMKSGLTRDAVVKGRDLDQDGDPDEIHIRLEVAELNGASPDSSELSAQYAIAPGIKPGLWVFVPKLTGMATENFESSQARSMLRVPAPAIRIEQGDQVQITLENGHYMPHTLHFHGVDHPFVDADGEGNDGVPLASELPVMPGQARTYNMQPRQAGTMFYHCHVQPHVHVMMGLQGLFIVEENRPNNWLQTMNIGAGQVRYPSVAVQEEYDHEYDLHYQDLDQQLNNRIYTTNDPRLVTKSLHRDYNIASATTDYFILNGRSFPYTFRESLVIVGQNENVKLRVVNGGLNGIALHTHGHKATVTHRDGVTVQPNARITRDVFWLATAQRLDLQLKTTNDGLHSFGEGIWLMHDHQGRGVTTNGIGPGGNISAIVYQSYLQGNGWPKTQGASWDPYFTEEYYRKEIPVWQSYAENLSSEVTFDGWLLFRILCLGLAAGTIAALLIFEFKRPGSQPRD
jgi:hypothetical protein